MSGALLKYDAACRALAEAHRIDEVKDILDKAEALRIYARQAKNLENEIICADIRLRAERRLGELLIDAKEQRKLHQGPQRSKSSDGAPIERIKLEDYGVDKKLSVRAQRIGHLPSQEFEEISARVRETIRERGSRIAFAAMNTADKQQRRENRERVLGECQSALPNKKYGVILADPEWRFEPWSRTTGMDRAADNHYPTSCTEIIAARDVPSIAAKDCVLFLWATAPMLPHALLVMAAWGFDYRSQIIWVKERIGTGYWFRNQHEVLLVGVRGKIPAPAMGTQWASIFVAPVIEHSAKPESILDMIEQYFPTLPKIELNRRGPARPGWNAWGNESETEHATAPASRQALASEPPPTGDHPGGGSPSWFWMLDDDGKDLRFVSREECAS